MSIQTTSVLLTSSLEVIEMLIHKNVTEISRLAWVDSG